MYLHKVQYYETDKMGIVHHSNYIRWMEEARSAFLESIGFGYRGLEDAGYGSPVLRVVCRYLRPAAYGDTVAVTATLKTYTGARLTIAYCMENAETGERLAVGETEHCFIDRSGRPISVRKCLPAFHAALQKELPENPPSVHAE